MLNAMWRARLVSLGAAVGIVALGLGVRMAGGGGAFAQHSGTALYAAMVYAGVFVLVPRAKPWAAGLAAIGFCWAVELFQLTGIPADLSARSLIARLVLGSHFDATDLIWYVMGVLPLVMLHQLAQPRSAGSPTTPSPGP